MIKKQRSHKKRCLIIKFIPSSLAIEFNDNAIVMSVQAATKTLSIVPVISV